MKKLKKDLLAAIVMTITAVLMLFVSTYAWYVTNNTVTAATTSISATTNGFILQIATAAEGAQHGGDNKSLAASIDGHKISPSSTNDLENWYISRGWRTDGKVTSYAKADVNAAGKYSAGNEDYYAYIMSEYILYTISESGYADVYLDPSEGSPIQVTVSGSPTSQTVPDSMRIAIATVDDGGNETLRVVYAPSEVSGAGNDANAISGEWTYINGDSPEKVTYAHIYGTTYTDQNGGDWAAVKSGNDYSEPESNGQKIASNVGYDGVKMRVYIWMEGTDADCINNSAAEDEAYYSVSVKLAGVTVAGG